MTDTVAATPIAPLSAWNTNLEGAVCQSCGWRYLIHAGQRSKICPHCCEPTLVAVSDETQEAPAPYPPELVVPFSVSEIDLSHHIAAFARGIPFPPEDLNAETLRQRLSPIYLPMWLVDGHAAACWEAEAGFDYEVISHQEYFDSINQWNTREVKETRARWEPRVGRLNRVYQNIALAAIEDAPSLEKQLGAFDAEAAQPYTSDCLTHRGLPVWVRLPDHEPQDIGSEISAEFQKTAAEECQQACGANRLRQFRWKAEFNQLNWTLLLLPVYTSYYQDDDGRPQPLLIHGQTGKVAGSRIASIQRARHTSTLILLMGLILAAAGVALGLIHFTSDSVILIGLGVVVAIASLVPFNRAWDFNREQVLGRASSHIWKI